MINPFTRAVSGAVALALFALAGGCQTRLDSTASHVKVSDLMKTQIKQNSAKNFDFLLAFASQSDAKAYENSALARGAQVQHLDRAGRILHVTSSSEVAVNESVPATTLAHWNNSIAIRPQVPGALDLSPEDFFTAREVVGVNSLVSRIPEADGREIKVAVFDTGIDFGVEGLEKTPEGDQKLLGFYDFTNFGVVEVSAVPAGSPKAEYLIGEKTLKTGSEVDIREVTGMGSLSEEELATNYLAGEGIDLNSNGQKNDVFPFLVGINTAGQKAVWVDLNMDGEIGKLDLEELTDYNSTHRFLVSRPEVAPSGARPLAVTFHEDGRVQFHSVPEGHGTSCALIIGGDGYASGALRGMAPKAKFLGYVLDASGQDVYTLDQFLIMFIHARDQGVSAISISWGFSTADLDSARFVADFLDREVSSQGVLIAIAAGNEGPGLNSATADDYIPHNGFAVGALVSERQARNVYGWTGTHEDSVVWYSSFGPTRGGRAVPDAMSPIVTLVRGERTVEPGPFYGFSGTSSATPALVGASTALMSALHAAGVERIDMRLLKLAMQNSALPLSNTFALRQGSGVINVDLAYDLYLKLDQEKARAATDPSKRSAFAYELRAETALYHPAKGQSAVAEGIYSRRYIPSSVVKIVMSDESKSMLDGLVFGETLKLVSTAPWIEMPQVSFLQTTGASFSVQFAEYLKTQPGTYTDVIEIKRMRDDLTLLRIPVVLEIPTVTGDRGGSSESLNVFEISQVLGPFEQWRKAIELSQASSLHVQGLILGGDARDNAQYGVHIRNDKGVVVYEKLLPIASEAEAISLDTPSLPAGDYEVIIFRHFGRPAVLRPVQFTATATLASARVVGARLGTTGVDLGIQAYRAGALESAVLEVEGIVQNVALTRGQQSGRPGFFGTFNLSTPAEQLAIGVRQSALDQALESTLHMSVALLNRGTNHSLYRGWINTNEAGSPLTDVELREPTTQFQVVAYPNIVNWEKFGTTTVNFEARVPLEDSVALTAEMGELGNVPFRLGQVKKLSFPASVENQAVISGQRVYGTLKLKGLGSAEIALPVELQF